MPVSLISGLAGSTGTIQDPGGLQAFADHLQRAKESQKKDAVDQLNMIFTLMKDTGGQWQPQEGLVDKLMRQGGFPKGFLAAATGRPAGTPGPAGKPAPGAYGLESVPGTAGGGPIPSMPGAPLGAPGLAPAQGPASTEAEAPPQSALEAMGSALRQKEAAATELSQAQLAQARAGTAASEQQTAVSKQQMQFAQDKHAFDLEIQGSERRIMANQYTNDAHGKAAREADIRMLGLEKGLSAEAMQRLGYSPDEQAEMDKMHLEDTKNAHQLQKLEFGLKVADMRVPDEKKKGQTRALTQQEFDDVVSGKKVPPGLTSQTQHDEMAMKWMQATATMMGAVSERTRADTYKKYVDAESAKLDAARELDLEKAKQLREKGYITSYDDVLKTLDTLRKYKDQGVTGAKVESLENHLLDALAGAFQGKPDDYTNWLGSLKSRGYIFGMTGGTPEPDALSSVEPDLYEMGANLPESLGAGVGAATRDIGGLIHGPIAGAEQLGRGVAHAVTGRNLRGTSLATPEEIAAGVAATQAQEEERQRATRRGR